MANEKTKRAIKYIRGNKAAKEFVGTTILGEVAFLFILAGELIAELGSEDMFIEVCSGIMLVGVIVLIINGLITYRAISKK